MKKAKLKVKLDNLYLQFNKAAFIPNDPISLPKFFSIKEDIEIIGFLVAILSWGQRVSIINSGKRLIEIFDNDPYTFITQHQDSDLKKCLGFVHRTFNTDDLLTMIAFLKEIYLKDGGLEKAFSRHISNKDSNVENALNGFRKEFETSNSFLKRTAKHIAYPAAGSACKRLNMFLRWMVRNDNCGVDFGIWKSILTSQLICPLDIHVIQQAYALGLISSEKSNWKTAIELTENLKKFDSNDPVKYDFALFGMGIENKNNKQNQKIFV